MFCLLFVDLISLFFHNFSQPTVIVKTFDQIDQITIVSHTTMNRSAGVEKFQVVTSLSTVKSQHSNNNNNNVDDHLNSRTSQSSSASGTGPIKKILLNIRINNEYDILVISCSSFAMAQSLANLLDGYHRLVTNSTASIWLNTNSNNNNDNLGKYDINVK